MQYTTRLIAHIIIYLPALVATLYGVTVFPDTTQREKMPLWMALLIITTTATLVVGLLYFAIS